MTCPCLTQAALGVHQLVYLDIRRVVGEDEGAALEDLLSQEALMLRLQVDTPLYRELEAFTAALELLHSLGVGYDCKVLVGHGLHRR